MKGDVHGASVFKPAFVLMSGRMLGFIASFMIPIVLVRVFNQTEFGTYKQLFLIYSTLYGMAQLGMAESLYYFLPMAPSSAGHYSANALLVLFGAGLLSLLLLWGGGGVIGDWFNNPALSNYLPLIGIYLLCMLVSTVLEISMISRKRYSLAFKTYLISDLARTALYIAPAVLFGSLRWLLIGALAFSVSRLALAVFYVARQFRSTLVIDRTLMKRHLSYALPFAVAVVIDMLQSNLHMYVVSSYLEPAAFAVYAIGCLQIPLIDFMSTSTANVMMVRMSEDIRDGKNDAVVNLWRDTTRKLTLIFVPLVGGLIVTSDSLIPALFTNNYMRSVPIFVVWSITMLFTALMTDGVLRVYADTKFIITLNILKLVIIAATINVFMAEFGMIGAVLVTLMAVLVAKAVALGRIRTLMHSNWRQVLPWRSLALIGGITAAAMLPALAVNASLSLSAWSATLVTGLTYGIVSAAALWLFGPLRDDERRMLVRWVRSPIVSFCRNWHT